MNKKPVLRFNGYTDDWEQRKLSELYINSGSGGTPTSTNKDYYNGEIPFLSIMDISNSDGYIYETEKNITQLGLDNSSAWLVPKDSISLAMYASVGKVAILKVDASTSQAFYNMVFENFCIRNFVFQYLKYMEQIDGWRHLISTGTQANLNALKVRNFKIPISTDISEIKRVSQILITIDNTLTLHQRELKLYETLKKTMLANLFPGQNKVKPTIRFKGFTDDWEQRELGSLTNIKTGSSDLQDAVDYGEYPLFVRSENIERSNRYIFDGEAILIPGEGRLGEIYHYINGKFDYHQRVYKISNFADSNTDGKFVLYYLQRNFKSHALKFTVKATVDSLRLPMLVGFEIKLPSFEEQKVIGQFFTNLDNLITLHQRELDYFKNQKVYFLKMMFV